MRLFKRRDVFATITRVSHRSNDWRVTATKAGRVVDEAFASDYAQARRFANYMITEESQGTIDRLRRAWRNMAHGVNRAADKLADFWIGVK